MSYGEVSSAKVMYGTAGKLWLGEAWRVMARCCWVSLGAVCYGSWVKAWCVEFCCGLSGLGEAGKVMYGSVRRVAACWGEVW